jgi:WD40 repeat protein
MHIGQPLTPSPDDDATVVIWDLESGSEVQSISVRFHGPVSVTGWLEVSRGRGIAFGCADGSIFIYRQVGYGVRTYLYCIIHKAHTITS